MHSRESVCDIIVFSDSMLDSAVNGHEEVLPSLELLAIWRLLHEGEQGFVICQDYTLVFSQLGFKEV